MNISRPSDSHEITILAHQNDGTSKKSSSSKQFLQKQNATNIKVKLYKAKCSHPIIPVTQMTYYRTQKMTRTMVEI